MTFRLRGPQIAALAQDHNRRQLAVALAARHLAVEQGRTQNLVVVRDPDGARAALELDEHGRIARYRHPSGREMALAYTPAHRLASLTLPSGNQANFAYDEQGRLAVVERQGQVWRLAYGARNDVAAIAYPDGSSEHFETDDTGNLLGYLDRDGRGTRFEHDEEQRLTRLVDPNGNATAFEYGVWDRPDVLVRPDGTREEAVRDGAGAPVELRVRGVPLAQAKFDSGRMSELVLADGEKLTLAYDDAGRLIEATTAEVGVKREFDEEGRLVRETIGDKSVEATYAFDGQLASITTDAGQIRYQYDADRRLAAIEDWLGGAQSFAYDAVDRTIVRTLPGLREETTLTPSGLPSQVVTAAAATNAQESWQQYAYDVNERLVASNDSHFGQASYGYDPEGQLLGAGGARQTEGFAYDAAGNRTAANGVASEFNALNQVVRAGVERFSYDDRGNLVERQSPEGTTRYEFGSRNLLLAATRPDGTRVEFTYDACGRRLSKRVGEKVTHYMWFGDQLVYEWLAADPRVRTDYLYKPGTHEPLAMRQNGAVYYFQNGPDGAPRRLIDAWGRTVWRGSYASFGQLTWSEGRVTQPLRFAGQYADDETGLYYNYARYYAADLGRYISRDPLEFATGPNPYLYCYNDPIGGRDPTGLLSGFWKAVAAATLVTVGVVACVVCFPVVVAAVGAASLTAGAVAAAGAVVVGGAAIGAGVRLGLAPDGCEACQKAAMIQGAIEGAGAALTAMSLALFPPGGAGLALAGGRLAISGGVLGTGAVAAGFGAIVASQMSKKGDGGGSDDDSSGSSDKTEPPKKQGDHVFAKGARKLPQEMREASDSAELPQNVKDRIGQAANEVDDALSEPALSEKVDKGPGPAGGDPQSTAFGDALKAQRAANKEFLDAAENAASAPEAQQAEAQEQLQQAGNKLKAANQNVLNNVEDTEASPLAQDPAQVDAGRAALNRAGQAQDAMVDDVVKMLKPSQ
jgi:RHS repeat-associated protein